MKVYVVEQGIYSGKHIVGISESLEEAKMISDAVNDSRYPSYASDEISITEYDTKAFRDCRLKFLVSIYDDDVNVEIVDFSWDLYKEFTETCYTGYGDYIIYAKNVEQAVKIARDMEAQRKAKEVGVAL